MSAPATTLASPLAVDPFADALGRLETWSNLCTLGVDAIRSGEASRIRDVTWLARAARAAVDLDELRTHTADLGADHPTRIRFERALQRADTAVEVIEAWMRQELPTAVHPEDTRCVARAIDAGIPLRWDPEHDLVILFGAGLKPFADELRARGQRRILFILTTREARAHSESTLGGKIVTRRQSNLIGLAPWVTEPPLRYAWFRDDSIEDDRARREVERLQRHLPEVKLWRNTVDKHGRTIVAQTCENLPVVATRPSIERLRGAFAGLPLVVIATGPSLARNVDQLRALQGRAVLCAASHSYAAVHAAGIRPDIVITIDMLDQRPYFEGLPVETTTLVAAASCHPGVVRLPAKHVAFCSSGSDFDAWPMQAVGETPDLPNGGTVAGAAMYLAHLMGCNPIVFVGLDLAFTDGHYYAGGVIGSDRHVSLDESTKTVEFRQRFDDGSVATRAHDRHFAVELPGYHGGTVISSPQFAVFHAWFERQAARLQGRVRLINATEGGSKIGGMEQMPLGAVVEAYGGGEPLGIADRLTALLGAPLPGERQQLVLARAQDMRRQVAAFLRAVSRGKKHTERLRRRIHPEGYEKFLRAHPSIIARLNALPFLALLHQVDFADAIHRIKVATTEAEQVEAAHQLYGQAEATSKWLLGRLEHSLSESRRLPAAA